MIHSVFCGFFSHTFPIKPFFVLSSYIHPIKQCFDPDLKGSADPDWESRSGSGSKHANSVLKRKNQRNFMFDELSIGLEASP